MVLNGVMKNKKKFTIFGLIPFIVNTKPKWEVLTEEQQKTFNSYLINKLLSMNPDYVELVNYVAGLNIQDNDKLYKIYCDLIPKNWKTYFPYIKGKGKSFNTELVTLISEYFTCSNRESSSWIVPCTLGSFGTG